MSVHGGKFGVVNGQSTVQNWSLNKTSPAQSYVASNTRGGTGRHKGNKDWSGAFLQHVLFPTLMPGSEFTFTGYENPTDDASGAGPTQSGPAIVDSVVISWDWAAGGIITTSVNFSGRGAVVVGTGTVTDATVPDPPNSIGTKIVLWDEATEEEWLNLVSAQLTLTQASQVYTNSSTNGWAGRKMGPFDWTLSVVAQGTEAEQPVVAGDDVWLRAYVDDTDFWSLKWGHVEAPTGLTVDRQSGAIIQRTYSVGMQASDGTELGEVVLPGAGAAFWPFAL